MRIELHAPGRKLLYGLLCLGLITGYVYRATCSYIVATTLESTDPEVLERAVRLEPQNAEAWYRLGRVRSVLQQDVPGSIAPIQRALALDPRHAPYWLELGLAYEYTGDTAARRAAIENALRLDSHDPDIAWEAGNFFLVSGDTNQALYLFHVALEGDDTNKHFGRAVLLSLRATDGDFARVLEEVIPRSPNLYLEFASFAASTNRFDAADMIWSRMVGLGKHVRLESTGFYFNSLLQRGDSARARSAWNDLAKVNPELQPYAYTDNLVVNGRFENDILNAGFDWHYNRNDAALLEIDDSGVHGGSHALLIAFTGQPVDDVGLQQTIPVDAGECYEFSAFLRASELEGVAGVEFLLRDLQTGHKYVQTESMTGTHGWEQRRQTFHTEPPTRYLQLSIVHERPLTTIRGRAWADDVRLTRVAPEACR